MLLLRPVISLALVLALVAPPGRAAAANADITPRASAVSASTDDGNVPGNVVDGDYATRWSGNGDGAWLELDLGAAQAVSHVQLAVHRGNERKNDFELQLWNGSVWTTVYDGLSSGTTTGLQTFDLADRQATRIRYVGHGYIANRDNTWGSWNSITEVKVWAPGSGAVLWSSTFDDFDDFKDGDAGIRQVDPPRTTAAIVADPATGAGSVGEFTINSGSRAEFMPDFRDLVEGDDLWFGVSTRLGAGYPTSAEWQVILQWKNITLGSPPLELSAEGDRYKLDGGYGHPGGDRYWAVDLGPASTEQWAHWVFHVKFSSDPTVGLVEVWRDGAQVVEPYKPRGGTLYPGTDSYLKVGYYRDSSIPTPGSVYYDNYRVGTSYSAVQPQQTGP